MGCEARFLRYRLWKTDDLVFLIMHGSRWVQLVPANSSSVVPIGH